MSIDNKNIDDFEATFKITGNANLTSQDMIVELRKRTGMNRKKFCEYLKIPYRTMEEWEKGSRKMPDYVLRMIEYQLRMEKLISEEEQAQ